MERPPIDDWFKNIGRPHAGDLMRYVYHLEAAIKKWGDGRGSEGYDELLAIKEQIPEQTS